MLKERSILQERLINVIPNLKKKKKVINDIKKHLAEVNQIIDTQSWFNDPENELNNLDIRELILFCEQVYAKTGDSNIMPNDFFTDSELKEAHQFSGIAEAKQNELSFPLTFANTTIVGQDAYMVTMSIQTIKQLMDNNLIFYNYETQREAKIIKRKDKVIIEPTLNRKSVNEITEHLLNGTLVPTVLVLNAETRSASSGEEIIYSSKKSELTITKDSRVSITDGFHRITASRNALQMNPDLEFNFAVLITNYSLRKSQQYMSQISKANSVSSVRIQELEASRLSDTVVQQLKEESELKGRISQTNRIHHQQLVTYNVLADTIEDEFKMETKLDAYDVGSFLSEMFTFLIGTYPNEFIHNIEQARKETLLVNNNFFVGYITLGSRLYQNKIKAREIRKILKEIDFSKTNEIWKKIGVIDEKGNISDTPKARKAIKQYFEQIKLNGDEDE